MKIEDLKKIKNIANPNNKVVIEEYFNAISTNCKNKMPNITKSIKIDDFDIITPTINNYYEMTKYNYNLQQLKSFAKNYNLKISGNKKELTSRLYTYLRLSYFIIKIQKVFKGFLQRKYNKIKGPGFKNVSLCTNNSDFITMEELKNIKPCQFFSYKDEDGFIYGFDIASLYTLIFKNGILEDGNKKLIGGQNPYNRKNISEEVIKNIKLFVRLSKTLHVKIMLDVEDDIQNITTEKFVELRAISLFQSINALGNYSDAQWFLSLNRNKLIKLVRELIDIWQYRAQLTIIVKRNICPPNGDPFKNQIIQIIHTETNIINLKNIILEILEKLVNSGINQDSKALGAYYVLAALTLVNETAASTLPWLFESVNHF